ncbi:MAG: redoxin domain-containing protein [Isosphaeraceae bacterium]|nr:redoxin domain-containing protein [Isosphaeraceae bacterium]
MTRSTRALCFVLLAGAGSFSAWIRLQSRADDDDTGPAIFRGGPPHVATPAMVKATEEMAQRSAPLFRTAASDGKTYSLADLAREGPLALFFIKDRCPCSRAAEPFFNQLDEAYGDRVRFFGIIDGDVAVAQRWGAENHVPFPILCDPELKIVREYKAENSAYTVLVARGGTIERYWPGYSAEMLREAGERLARLAGVDVKPLDLNDAPDYLYSGCPY